MRWFLINAATSIAGGTGYKRRFPGPFQDRTIRLPRVALSLQAILVTSWVCIAPAYPSLPGKGPCTSGLTLCLHCHRPKTQSVGTQDSIHKDSDPPIQATHHRSSLSPPAPLTKELCFYLEGIYGVGIGFGFASDWESRFQSV